MMDSSRCKLCGQEIAWIKGRNGHMIPVDPEPIWIQWDKTGRTYMTKDGNYIIGYPAGDAAEGDNIVEGWQKHARDCTGKIRKRRNRA